MAFIFFQIIWIDKLQITRVELSTSGGPAVECGFHDRNGDHS
ncbi:hypothetical protein [Lentimicrobium sp.]|nr:hypothetical protein [Lentimicrobium sp.]